MLNFTVGPVQIQDKILSLGKDPVPYFRTPEFSKIMIENEQMMKTLVKADDDSRVVFLTGSGTAAMEASVINTLTSKNKVLIINGGTFGARFVDICVVHHIPHEIIQLAPGQDIKSDDLVKYTGKGFDALLINMHETSTGVLYNMPLIARFCKQEGLFLIIDCISAFLADKVDMSKLEADIIITASQKALACPPGISILVLSKDAVQRIKNCNCPSLYLNLASALENGIRGQTPFTPAVSILLQIHKRLEMIISDGGQDFEINKVEHLAKYFRSRILHLPLKIFSSSPSNAVTSLETQKSNACEIFKILKDQYGIWVCPNGGKLKDRIFRVGHIGDLKESDYDRLISALETLNRQGIL